MRLTIARKIALAVIAIVILCIGTMAWVTSTNLKRGFVAYLNEMQSQDLDNLRDLMAARYRSEGNFDWLRRQPRALRTMLDSMKLQIQAEPGGRARRPRGPDGGDPHGRPRRGEGPPGADRPPRREQGAGPPAVDRPPRRDQAAQPEQGDGPPGADRPEQRDQPPQPGQRDPMRDEPPEDPLGLGPEGDRARAQRPPPEPPAVRDPMGFAARLSIVDADGRVLIGPPDAPPGMERAVIVDGKTVATMRLRPLRQAGDGEASAAVFLHEQMRDILLLSLALVGLAVLLALGLARHFLRPVVALREVTARLAQGDFGARAPVLSRDELAELALHVNAMAQALEESEQQRRRMVADISHELRTPLTVIRGEIEALLDGIRQADPRALESLHAEVLRLNKLVDDLHQLALADAGDLHYAWRPVELQGLLTPLLERYSARFDGAGLVLSWQLTPTLLTVQADPDRLTQVIINLLENSIRYTDCGGHVRFTLAHGAGQAELTIDDSAPGVPDGVHASLFERLYRVDQARTRERGGSGLGLAICKVIVEAHGGTIVASASHLGGVRMLIRLPLSKPHEA